MKAVTRTLATGGFPENTQNAWGGTTDDITPTEA